MMMTLQHLVFRWRRATKELYSSDYRNRSGTVTIIFRQQNIGKLDWLHMYLRISSN